MEQQAHSSNQVQDVDDKTPECDGGKWICNTCSRIQESGEQVLNESTTEDNSAGTNEELVGSTTDPTLSSSLRDEMGNLIPEQAPLQGPDVQKSKTWDCLTRCFRCKCNYSPEPEKSPTGTNPTDFSSSSPSTNKGLELGQQGASSGINDGSPDSPLETEV